MEVLDRIPVQLDPETVVQRLRLPRGNTSAERVAHELLEMILPIARPKAVYAVAFIEGRSDDAVAIGGVRFTSRVLRVNLDHVERVFPYVATCGTELEAITFPSTDVVKGYFLDAMKNLVLRSAVTYLAEHLQRTYALGQLSRMTPGSLADWPVTQQRELFALLEDVEQAIGVTLTDHCLMIPLKSVSGLYFPTEIKFESCLLCPRAACSGRRAPYDPVLLKKYARQKDI
jgi:hypothetical protein